MDLSYDTFYPARQEAIEKRLQELRDGQGPAIIAEFDDRERSKQTLCVGVRWDMFEKTDLVEIAEVRYTLPIYFVLISFPVFRWRGISRNLSAPL